MAQFGKESAKPFDELHKLVKGLLFSAKRLAEIWANDVSDIPQEAREEHDYRRQQYEAIFWEKSEDDEVNSSLTSIIKRIEDTCFFIISPNGTVYSFTYTLNKLSELIKKRSPFQNRISEKRRRRNIADVPQQNTRAFLK
jgi:hypothetical protein